MLKKELEAENARLTDENEALRELLGAVQALAAVPKPADYADRYFWACEIRLSTIATWAQQDEHSAGPYAARVMRGWAARLRERAAEPVQYEVRAAKPDDEAAEIAPNPPYHVTGFVIGEASCEAEDSGYVCNSQAGHDGPQHVAYVTGGAECHRWPVSVALRIGGNLVPLGGQS